MACRNTLRSNCHGLGAIYLPDSAGDINPRIVGVRMGTGILRPNERRVTREGASRACAYQSCSPKPLASPHLQIETAEILLTRTYGGLAHDTIVPRAT
jgi:hypothetical protein